MLLALIADIHGNLVALEAALRGIERHRPDEVLCLGDVAASGPRPAACIRRVGEVCSDLVLGNTDAWLLLPADRAPPSASQPELRAIDAWGREQLTDAEFRSLRSYTPTIRRTLPDANELVACHGSPHSFDDAMWSTTPDDEIATMLHGVPAPIVTAGHTHQPMIRRFRSSLLINPGSVGMPLEFRADGSVRNPPWAEYALVRCEAGEVSASLHRAPIDPDAVARDVRSSGMPHADFWLQ